MLKDMPNYLYQRGIRDDTGLQATWVNKITVSVNNTGKIILPLLFKGTIVIKINSKICNVSQPSSYYEKSYMDESSSGIESYLYSSADFYVQKNDIIEIYEPRYNNPNTGSITNTYLIPVKNIF